MPSGRVPDLRGMFLRGHGSQASVHWGTVTHQSEALGQIQGDATRRIQGSLSNVQGDNNPCVGVCGGGAFRQSSNAGYWAATYSSIRGYASNLSFDSGYVTPIAPENRPVNVAVRYLVRALN